MQGIEQEHGGAQIVVGWPDGTPDQIEWAGAYAAALVRALTAAGFQARRIEVGLRRGRLRVLELLVRGDVPGLAESEFPVLARRTLNALSAGRPAGEERVVLWARLDPDSDPVTSAPLAPSQPSSPGPESQPVAPPLPIMPGDGASRAEPPSAKRAGEREVGRAVPGELEVGRAVQSAMGPLAAAAGTNTRRPATLEPTVDGKVCASVGPMAGGVAGGGNATLEPTIRGPAGRGPAGPRSGGPRVFGRSVPVGKVAIGVLLGCALGVLGLPRLELAFLPSFGQPQTAAPGLDELDPGEPRPAAVRDAQPTPVQPTATVVPAPPTLAVEATPTAVVSDQRVLFAERFGVPLANWPNDPQGPAWFAGGAFHLFARQPGRFVAAGLPLAEVIDDATVSAQFHKLDGPVGGGYGLIIRDQRVGSERDPSNQAGQYLVFEVGDRGEIGVWQRAETRWIDIIGWTHSDAVHLDQKPNALTVTTRGASARFEVNGEVVANVTYTALAPTNGGVGVFVGGDLNHVALDSLRIETLHK